MPDTPIDLCDHDEKESRLRSQPAEEPQVPGHFPTSSHSLVHVVRDSLRPGAYSGVHEGDPGFPTQKLDKAGVHGHAQLIPATVTEPQLLPPDQHNAMVDQMWRLQKKLGDVDADYLDALNYRWLDQARHLGDSAVTSIEDLLRLRGLKPNQSGAGRLGGYKEAQRIEVLLSCARLQSLFLNVTLEPVKYWKKKVAAFRTRVIVITDIYGQMRLLDQYLDVHKFIHRPGERFAEFLTCSRHTALLSVKALAYDPYRQVWEKRLTRYLTWIWRIRAGDKRYLQPHCIEKLLEQIGQRIDHRHPRRTFERLKKAFETMQADDVIACWRIDWDEKCPLREAMITIEPPDAVKEFYSKILGGDAQQLAAAKKAQEPTVGELVKIRRQELGLTQAVVAKELQTATSYVSQLENGGRVSEGIRGKLEAWLNNHPRPTQVLDSPRRN